MASVHLVRLQSPTGNALQSVLYNLVLNVHLRDSGPSWPWVTFQSSGVREKHGNDDVACWFHLRLGTPLKSRGVVRMSHLTLFQNPAFFDERSSHPGISDGSD